MELFDRVALDKTADIRRTRDGYLVATPRVARIGIQLYRGSEVGRPDLSVVRVMRPASEVFADKALASIAYKPITDDHPKEMVTDKNWKKYAVGQAGGEVAQDGKFVRVPMAMMDGNMITKVEAGKAEISLGYSCELDWTPGVHDGQEFDCSQKDIIVNHIAIVDAARGGPQLKIGDGTGIAVDIKSMVSAVTSITKGDVNTTDVLTDGSSLLNISKDGHKGYPFGKDGTVYASAVRQSKTEAVVAGDTDIVSACDSLLQLIETTTTNDSNDESERKTQMSDKTLKLIQVDGISVQTDDVGSQVIERHIKSLSDSVADLTKKLSDATSTHTTELKAKDEAIAKLTTDAAALTTQIETLKKQVEDSAVTPAKLDQLVKDRAAVVDTAKKLLGDKLVVDGKTESEIKRQVVDAKLGDKAKGWTDEQIAISFSTLADAMPAASSGVTDMARTFSSAPATVTDAAKARDAALDARDARLQNAWKGETAGKA